MIIRNNVIYTPIFGSLAEFLILNSKLTVVFLDNLSSENSMLVLNEDNYKEFTEKYEDSIKLGIAKCALFLRQEITNNLKIEIIPNKKFIINDEYDSYNWLYWKEK